jgi:outer membrane protein assembly factor BamD (BamD/ComL family)
MYRNISTPLLLLIISILTSCGVTKDYQYAVFRNSIDSYESYLELYPKSKYKPDVNSKLKVLYEERDWNNATSAHTIDAYKVYIALYPNGKHKFDAEERIVKIKRQIEIDESWNNSKETNTVEAYQAFIDRYPDAYFYCSEAKTKIKRLVDDDAWAKASSIHTIESYNEYLKSQTEGKYRSKAFEWISKITEEKTILPIWNQAKQKNTYQAYAEFLRNYPKSSYSKQAQENMDKIESFDWEKATRSNTIRGYQSFISKFPNSEYVEIAEKRIIDLEVDKIFDGDYGMLPPLSRDSYGGYKSTNSVEIYNNTGYNLTIRYSGSESKKIILYPKQRLTTTLPNGSYRITASVNAANVRNYAGNETLSGGNYSSEYYIITTRF